MSPVTFLERVQQRWHDAFERWRPRLKRTFAGELVVRSVDLKLVTRATVLSTQQVACLAPLAVGVMAMVNPSNRGNIGSILSHLVGLDPLATHDLTSLFSSSHKIATGTGAVGLLFLLVWALAVPGYTQRLLEDIWALDAGSITRSLPAQVAWFIGFIAEALALGALPIMFGRRVLDHPARGTSILLLLGVSAVFLVVQLVSNHALLGARVSLARLLPGTLISVIGMDLAILAMHWFASPVITSTVAQFGLVGITFLAQASAVVLAGAVVFGELLGAEHDRRRHPDLWPSDVVVHEEDEVAGEAAVGTPPDLETPTSTDADFAGRADPKTGAAPA